MRILIAVDGSEAALRGVAFAGRLASQLPAASLTLLYVRASYVGPVVSLGAPGPLPEVRLEREVHVAEDEIFAEARALLRTHGLEAETAVAVGQPGPTINRYAADGGFELIVLGSRHHGEIKSAVLGGTIHVVVHGAPCSVLVVR